jgi:GAF domain-containing protein
MAESLLDVRGLAKPEAYDAIAEHLGLVLEGMHDPITTMATMSSVIHHGFGHLWTGFYRAVAPELLRVGPYQGTLGCLEIAFGRGVCGTAARERRTVVVPDVNTFPGHISCDGRSRSEIVVPVLDRAGRVSAVLDIDSEQPATFDDEDARRLESLVQRFLPSVA